MGKVRIVTDSNANLSPEMLEEYDIEVIPHLLNINGSTYTEYPDFTVDKFFDHVRAGQNGNKSQLPRILSPDINSIIDIYQSFGAETEEIISIHMSSELSPIYHQARRAAQTLRGRYSIRVIDSMSTSFGLKLLVEQAVRASEAGANLNEIARLINGAVPHLYVTFFAESLPYLERSTNLSTSQSILGTLLGIKAMVMLEDGQLVSLEKVQAYEEVVEKMCDFVTEFARVEQVGLIQHCYAGPQSQIVRRLKDVLPGVPMHYISYPPSLATYLGPNAIGVVVYEGKL